MIDLHTHILPGIDDGAKTLEVALEMARMAAADGTTVMACTPHIYPGLYMNDSEGITAARDRLQHALDVFHIPLRLVVGADAHLVPELLEGLKSGRVPTLNASRYFLLEPSHHVAPPQFENSVFQIMAAGYVPIITHPERLGWIEQHYAAFTGLARRGAWLQLTAGSITGVFGNPARYWSERLLAEGMVHMIASDAHNTSKRNPVMSSALPALEAALGKEEAWRLVQERPQAVLDNLEPSQVPPVPGMSSSAPTSRDPRPWYKRILRATY